VGMKSHGVYETPGGSILLFAHRDLESLVLDHETLSFKQVAAVKYADLTYNGLWFTPLREALDAFVNSTQGPVTGTVRLKLYKGNIMTAGRKSPFSLYREDFATFGEEDVYDQSHAEGFIRLYGLSLKVRALNGLPVMGMNMPKPDYSRFKRD
jgi:argininosuccinate synthase